MPDPVTVLLGGLVLLVALGLVSFSRFHRLRTHIDDSAAAVTAERERRDRLMERAAEGHLEDQVVEQVAEAEDRLEAVNRLHTAQVRTWNRLGRGLYWRLLRGVTGWQPLPEHPSERTGSGTAPSTARSEGSAADQPHSSEQLTASGTPDKPHHGGAQPTPNGTAEHPHNGTPDKPHNGAPDDSPVGAPEQAHDDATDPANGATKQPYNGAPEQAGNSPAEQPHNSAFRAVAEALRASSPSEQARLEAHTRRGRPNRQGRPGARP